jgi:hypothetical protein
MTSRLELPVLDALPLWAKVLAASRIARRAALWMPNSASENARTLLVQACDAIDRWALAGERLKPDLAIVERAKALRPRAAEQGAVMALFFAADAAHAAESALDFSAAESACHSSMLKAFDAAKGAAGLNPIQVQIFIAADVDLLGFACKEANIDRYQGLGRGVAERLFPVYPPDNRDDDVIDDDPTGGAR